MYNVVERNREFITSPPVKPSTAKSPVLRSPARKLSAGQDKQQTPPWTKTTFGAGNGKLPMSDPRVSNDVNTLKNESEAVSAAG